ncbi:MAG: RNA-binding S4 domain-containing protein [Bacillota bacterium]|nr:RNA-binding S4 domain-containing protein [Bacillota bacterium]
MKKQDVVINTEFIKLSQLLKYAGIAMSGGESGELITSGNVKVNDKICLEKGKKIFNGDIVSVKDIQLKVLGS